MIVKDLKRKLKDSAKKSFESIQSKYQNNVFRAFALSTDSDCQWVIPIAATDQYINFSSDTWLWYDKWDILEFEECNHMFEVSKLLENYEPNSEDGTTYVNLTEKVLNILVEVMHELSMDGCFGKDRDHTFISVALVDSTEPEGSIKTLNSKSIYSKYEALCKY